VKTESDKLFEWCRGNEDAVKMLKLLGEASQLADDLVDGDAENPTQAMGRLLSITFVDLMLNSFFMAYRTNLVPLFATSIQFWSVSDSWGKSGIKESQMYGYVYREMLEQVITMTAYIIGGSDHAREVTLELHEHYHTTDQDKFSDWVSEVNHG